MDNRDITGDAIARQPQGGISRPASRYNPLYEMQEQMRRMDALFNRVFGFEPLPAAFRTDFDRFQRHQAAEPDVDIYESDTEYIVHAALPGVEPHDINLEATEESITLSALRRSPFGAAPQGSQSNPGGQQPTVQPAQGQRDGSQMTATGQNMAGGASAGQTHNQTAGEQGAREPHTQHRQSRYSSQSRFQLVYTLPSPIDPDSVRASFRNGVLELHLPKQRPPSTRTVPIAIEAGGARQGALPGQQAQGGGLPQGQQATVQAPISESSHEGAPSNKMGSNYTPSAGEDHAAQAQSIGARTDHETGRQENPIAGGQTNPMGGGLAPAQQAPVEAGRS